MRSPNFPSSRFSTLSNSFSLHDKKRIRMRDNPFFLICGLIILIVILMNAYQFFVGLPNVNPTGYLTKQGSMIAKENAFNWAEQLFKGKSHYESCSNLDSDRDRYVSCSVRAEEQVVAIECGYMSENDGCKIAQMKLNITTE